ncbi:L-histidine N(alpha)-methyltransferase [Fulvimarina sp. MAC3]|uniref:L-histidine N(alpha)-methyltransferase n=1 Tax=Fulvimarina sp. MAC3 TaxID=3148887 RepID=UPI0031FCCCC4
MDVVAIDIEQRQAFLADVLEGLSRKQKTLPSRWLYDDEGSELFEAITAVDEYYPTRTETQILTDNAAEIGAVFGRKAVLIEYGAGAGVKTEIVLSALEAPECYVPVDIAGDFLESSADRLRALFRGLAIRPVTADFTADFDLPDDLPRDNRGAFFPGSTLGNLAQDEARALLSRVRGHVGAGGRFVIGIDLKKDIETLLAAYDDKAGVTAAFNLNILKRINRELSGSFDIQSFEHAARWNPKASAVEMHLVCVNPVRASVGDQTFTFEGGETIHTESSRKYDLDGFSGLAHSAGWSVDRVWSDERSLFAVVALTARDGTGA